MGKGLIEVKLKSGKKIEVYEKEQYRLWKRNKIEVDKKTEEIYKAKLAEEEEKKIIPQFVGNTKFEKLENRIKALEKENKKLIEMLEALDSKKPKPGQTK